MVKHDNRILDEWFWILMGMGIMVVLFAFIFAVANVISHSCFYHLETDRMSLNSYLALNNLPHKICRLDLRGVHQLDKYSVSHITRELCLNEKNTYWDWEEYPIFWCSKEFYLDHHSQSLCLKYFENLDV